MEKSIGRTGFPRKRRLPAPSGPGGCVDMQAYRAYIAGTMSRKIQYTIRDVPKPVDDALRRLAVREGASLNRIALQALEAASGAASGARHHDLDELAGTWVRDPAFDRAVAAFDRADERLWK